MDDVSIGDVATFLFIVSVGLAALLLFGEWWS